MNVVGIAAVTGAVVAVAWWCLIVVWRHLDRWERRRQER